MGLGDGWGGGGSNADKERKARIKKRIEEGKGMPGSGGKMPEKNRGQEGCPSVIVIALGSLALGAWSSVNTVQLVASWIA